MTNRILLCLLICWPIVAGLALCLRKRRATAHYIHRFALAAVSVPFLAALLCMVRFLYVGAWSWRLEAVLGAGLHFRLDGFRAVYICLSAFLWLVTTQFSAEYFGHGAHLERYYSFCLLTLGATMGVFLSADFFTTFLFFEMLSLTSYPLVIHDEKPAAMRAGETYLAVAVIGGMVMLMGMLLLYHELGTLSYELLYSAAREYPDRAALYLPGALMIVGFGAKAGMFPLHIWLPKAHPVAPAPASALLSGILTKTGVYGVLAVTGTLFLHDGAWGLGILLPGTVTMVWGGILALLSVDMKRILACSSVSQIGFILVGVAMQCLLGEHNALAVRGTILHMVNHSLLKLVLFLLAGVVYRELHRLHLDEIRGFGRGRPLFGFLFAMGALGIAGVPFWNGYVSKTLLHESIVEAVHLYHGLPVEHLLQWVEYLFLFTGGLTVAYMLKLFVALFLEKPAGQAEPRRGRYLSPVSAVLLTVSALLLPVLGVFTPLMDAVAALSEGFVHGHPPEHAVHYFAWINLKGAVISLVVGIAVYGLVVRRLLMRHGRYVDRLPRWFDMENLLYRPLLRGVAAVGVFFGRIAETLPEFLIRRVLNALRQSRPKEEVTAFYARFYQLIRPSTDNVHRERVLTGTLTCALLLFGVGLSVLLLYAFFSAV